MAATMTTTPSSGNDATPLSNNATLLGALLAATGANNGTLG